MGVGERQWAGGGVALHFIKMTDRVSLLSLCAYLINFVLIDEKFMWLFMFESYYYKVKYMKLVFLIEFTEVLCI